MERVHRRLRLTARGFPRDTIPGGHGLPGEADALIEKARTVSDSNERLNLYRKLYEMLREDVPLIPIYTDTIFMFFNAKLRNFYPHPVYRYAVHEMYFDK